MANKFGRCKQYKGHVDLSFVDGSGKKIGEIRLKPNRILWASSGTHGWRRKELHEFQEFMESGESQSK
jgi:hypothetical protein